VETQGAPPPPVRVLVVDDDAACRGLVAEALGDEGYEVLGAPDGRAALALLAAPPPGLGLVLLDLWLPGADGAAVAAAYRRLPGPHAPVLLLSAAAGAAAHVAALGAVGLLAKPFDLDALLAAVRRHAAPAARPAAATPAPAAPVLPPHR
jgi:DNA-binding response OmpR family regulator